MLINKTGLIIDTATFMDIKNVISYVEFMNSRKLTSLEQLELQDCLDSLKKKRIRKCCQGVWVLDSMPWQQKEGEVKYLLSLFFYSPLGIAYR